jgi:hypothetical protein
MDFDLLLEAERRGILPADKADLLAEARRRGLVPGGEGAPPQPNTNPGVNPEAPPEMFLNPQTGQYTSRELLTNHMMQNETAPTTAMGATIMGAGRGATLGGIDEISGYLNAAIPGQGTMAERNTFGREMARAAEDAGTQSNPDDMLTSEIAGAVSVPFAAPFQGMSLLPRMAGGAMSGAAMGAAYGGLTGEGQEERADQAQSGMILGGAVGGAAPLVGAGVQKIADGRAGRRAIREAVKAAPTTEALRAEGRAAYQAIDDAGVAINPDVARQNLTRITRLLSDEGLDPTITPNANRVAGRLNSAVPARQPQPSPLFDPRDGFPSAPPAPKPVPFEDLDMLRRVAGNAAGANPTNRADTRLSTMALEEIDDFVRKIGPDDVTAGDLETLQTMLPKARETWARMSRSQMIDDAIEAGSNNYLSGPASGIRNQFGRILRNPKLSRGFSDAEIKMMRRVVNGTLPEQIINYMGSGLGMVAQTMAGGAAGLAGGIPGMMAGSLAGAATGAGTRKLSEKIVTKNAEIARALVASGKVPQLPVASPAARQVTEALMRRAGATVPQ